MASNVGLGTSFNNDWKGIQGSEDELKCYGSLYNKRKFKVFELVNKSINEFIQNGA
jgi:hypothetical protein